MYSTFGLPAEAKGVGIAGCRSGRLEIVALSGRRARLFLCSLYVRFEAAFLFARSSREMLVGGAVVTEWVRGLGVLYGAALVREAFVWVLVFAVASVSVPLEDGCACPQGGVSVMGISCGCCGWSLLWGLRSPLRVRFWPAMAVRLDLCVQDVEYAKRHFCWWKV